MRVLCVTPNMSIDRTLSVPGFNAGAVWRAEGVVAGCGGKGINVARAVVSLGHEATCSGILGGHAGRLAAESAAAEGLAAHWTWCDRETRTCVIVVGDSGEATVINEPGPSVKSEDWRRFIVDSATAASGTDAVCISGSLPPNTPKNGLHGLVSAAGESAPVWLDTSGAALNAGIAARPYGLKINAAEAAVVLESDIKGPREAIDAARKLRSHSIEVVAITLGPAGAVMVDGKGAWWAVPPTVPAVSPVGSGDAFLAGLATSYGAGAPAAEALCLAVAAGTANAMVAEAGRFSPTAFRAILDATCVEPAER